MGMEICTQCMSHSGKYCVKQNPTHPSDGYRMAFTPDIGMTPQLRIMHDGQNTITTTYSNHIPSIILLSTCNSHNPNQALRSHVDK